MQFNASQISSLINGKIEGDAGIIVNSFGKIEDAKEGQLTFLANPKYEDFLYTTGASVVIINDSLELKQPLSATVIRVKDAYTAFAQLLTFYQDMQTRSLSGKQEPVFIHPAAKIGNNVFLGAFCYVGENAIIEDDVKLFPQTYIGSDVTVGKGSVLHPGVKIYHNCIIGSQVTIHAGTVIGADGFGFAPQADGSYKKIPQIGNVIIEDQVEIGANTAIDRATIGSTIIRKGVKLDNLIQIAHNVEIGEDTVIAAQAGISGSTKIGKKVMIGGQAGIVGHVNIADGCKINAQSGVSKSIKEKNQSVNGTPAFDYTASLRAQAISRNLPEIEKRIKELEIAIREHSASK